MTYVRALRVTRWLQIGAAFVLISYYWALVRLRPRTVLRRACRADADGPQPLTRASRARVNAVLSAVARASQLHPLRPGCLEQALAARTILSSAGEPARVVIGINSAPALSAHAWVEVGRYANDASRPAFAALIRLS